MKISAYKRKVTVEIITAVCYNYNIKYEGHADMKQKLFDKSKYAPSCTYCLYGKLTADEESVLCVKKGIMLPESSCRKYVYDPLKRKPMKPMPLEEHEPDEFKL